MSRSKTKLPGEYVVIIFGLVRIAHAVHCSILLISLPAVDSFGINSFSVHTISHNTKYIILCNPLLCEYFTVVGFGFMP